MDNFLKRRILQNVSLNFIIRGITLLFSFLTVMYATRVLQPTAFGRVSFAASIAGYFVMISSLGMPVYAMRTCAEKRDDRKELSRVFNELWSINVVLSVCSIVVLLVLILLVPKLREDGLLLVIYGGGIIFQTMGCEWLFRGLEEFRFLAVSMLICKILSFIGIILFVTSEQQVVQYAVFSVLTTYGSSIICFCALHRHVDLSFHIRVNKSHFKPLIVFFLMSCAVYVYSDLDLTMLGFMRTEFETGLYSVAAKVKSVLAMTGGIVWASILPTATRIWKEDAREQFESLAGKTIMIVCGIQFLLTVVCVAFAREIILVIGGESYLGAVTAFRILLLSLIPIGASNILGGQVLIPAGRENRLLRAEVVGAVFNFAANLIVIPIYSIEGAACTTVVSEVIVWLICLYYVKKDLRMDLGPVLILKSIRKTIRVMNRFIICVQDRLWGDKLPLYCPCCDTHLRKFIHGNFSKLPDAYNIKRYEGMDQNVICPICGSLPRHRILVIWMNENIEWMKNKSVLHFAQERALRIWLDRHEIKYTTADLFNPADLKIDIECTGLDDESYDMIICNHVLEHVNDYHKALAELHRIISTEGKIVLSFPTDRSFEHIYEDMEVNTKAGRVEHFGQHDHLRVFGRDTVTMLENFGFKVQEIRGEAFDDRIKPIIGPADYDYNVLWCLTRKK